MRHSIFGISVFILVCFVMSGALAEQTASSADEQHAAALTGDYNSAYQAKDWPHAVEIARQLVGLSATPERLRLLGNAQLNAGAMSDALATYEHAIAQAEAEKPANGVLANDWKELLGKLYVGKGNALLKLRRNSDAIEAYNKAAEVGANPGLAYFNICAVLYNTGNMEAAVGACRKSLQYDPGRADTYFLLGSALFVTSPTDAHVNYMISSETRQALEKYLELAPGGPHAADVKAMLEMSEP